MTLSYYLSKLHWAPLKMTWVSVTAAVQPWQPSWIKLRSCSGTFTDFLLGVPLESILWFMRYFTNGADRLTGENIITTLLLLWPITVSVSFHRFHAAERSLRETAKWTYTSQPQHYDHVYDIKSSPDSLHLWRSGVGSVVGSSDGPSGTVKQSFWTEHLIKSWDFGDKVNNMSTPHTRCVHHTDGGLQWWVCCFGLCWWRS